MNRKLFSRRYRRDSRRGQRRRLPSSVSLLGQATHLAVSVSAALAAWPGMAFAAAAPDPPDPPTEPTVTSLDEVVNNLRLWLLGILAAYATLCLVIAFIRYTSGEADEVAKAKVGFRSAAIGYAGAILAPLLVTIIGGWL